MIILLNLSWIINVGKGNNMKKIFQMFSIIILCVMRLFHHNIKIAFRNLRKYKTQNIISIIGLAIGFTCFAFSALWISGKSESCRSGEKRIEFHPEMHATAEIITEDLRLLERLFLPLKKIFGGQKLKY